MITRGVLTRDNLQLHGNLLFHYHAKPAVLWATLEPGDDSKDRRLAAIPEDVTGRALINCCAVALSGWVYCQPQLAPEAATRIEVPLMVSLLVNKMFWMSKRTL